MEPFRFIHAARLLLDRPLRGTLLHDGRTLPEAIRPLVQEATFLAWDQVVEACLAHDVDLLVLAGDSFDRHDHSLRAPTALIRGCERLADRQIAVVIAAGPRDPWEIWPAWLKFPPNVIRLGIDGKDSAQIVRDGHRIAYVTLDSPGTRSTATADGDTWPGDDILRLVVSPGTSPFAHHDAGDATGPRRYRACGGADHAQTHQSVPYVAHDPGPTQATHPLEAGPRGCTLVTIDPSGEWRETFVPVAPVRFEQVNVTVTPEQTRDDLLFEMLSGLDTLPRHATDRLWLVSWHLYGQGPLLEMLATGSQRDGLLELVHAEHGLNGVAIATSAVRVFPAPHEAPARDVSGSLAAEFERRLAERPATAAALRTCLAESPLSGGPWEVQLESLIAELDAGEVAHDARRLGMAWFAAEEELSS